MFHENGNSTGSTALINSLDRELEVTVIVMEAFERFETGVRYDIVGHSGESRNIPFVDVSNPPND